MQYYEEPAKKLPVREVDVVVAGGGTAGVVAALAAARNGAKTMLIEAKGYTGGIVVEGGTALHSYLQPVEGLPRRREAPGRRRHPAGDRRPPGRSGRHDGPRRDDRGLRLRLDLHRHRHRDLQARDAGDAARGGRRALRQHAAGRRDCGRRTNHGRDHREPLRAGSRLRQSLRGLHRLRRPGGLRRGGVHRAERLSRRQQHRRRRREPGEVPRVPRQATMR